jgi:molybdenum cofactor sulfurtransferase
MERFTQEMTSQLWCNPHSTSTAAQATSKRIESIRLQLLGLFNADPEEFDLVFVANATAGIKLVGDAFRDVDGGFWFGHHAASHTSIVGLRELAVASKCFGSNGDVETWLDTGNANEEPQRTKLFAYPAQSNMNGTRFPLDWCRRARALSDTYSLLDAAALASTSALDLGDAFTAPDFAVISLYKAFGFPDLGALIIRKASAQVLRHKKYFGGGTVDMVVCGERWHAKRETTLHEILEDGSLPIHNILALDAALSTHRELFGSLNDVSNHCAVLSQRLYSGLETLRHWNGQPVCKLYHTPGCDFQDLQHQGPTVAFNVYNSLGSCIGSTEVEKLASIKNIQLRTGGLCNPGGVAIALELSPDDLKRNHASGQRCGNDFDIMHGRPVGMIRVSLGPENTVGDVDKFLTFVQEFFVDINPAVVQATRTDSNHATFSVESLTIYPIKSCCGWKVPPGIHWEIRPEGLAWDREWCVIRSGDGGVMSQKRYPKMALIRPTVDVQEGLLRVEFADKTAGISPIAIPLTLQPTLSVSDTTCRNAQVCGDNINALAYTLSDVTRFFTEALGVPCQLGRFPPSDSIASARHAKPHLQAANKSVTQKLAHGSSGRVEKRPILLSNESPILIVSRSSINQLNEHIKANNGKAVGAEAFRPNIVIMEHQNLRRGSERAYLEDEWRLIQVGREIFELLGKCRRCQMVCIDQDTGQRNQEPFVTLAKTRRMDGKVYFGQHACHMWTASTGGGGAAIAVGDAVVPIA